MANPKTTIYVGGLDENVTDTVLHAAFVPFGEIKDVNVPLDQGTQKNRGFGFVTYMEKEDAAAAIDNMHSAELYSRVLTCNLAQPVKVKGGEQGWAAQPVWADADTWFERQQKEEEAKAAAQQKDKEATLAKVARPAGEAEEDEEEEEGVGEGVAEDPMAAAEAEAQAARNGS